MMKPTVRLFTRTSAQSGSSGSPPVQSGGGSSGGKGSSGAGGGGDKGVGDSGSWDSHLPEPPRGWSWPQIARLLAAAIGTWGLAVAIFVSPVPDWVHDKFSQAFPRTSSKISKDAENLGVLGAVDKAKSTAVQANATVKQAATDVAKDVTPDHVPKADEEKSDMFQSVKGAAASVGRVLHIVPEDKDKAKSSKSSEKEDVDKDWLKSWQAYTSAGVAVGLIFCGIFMVLFPDEFKGSGKKGKKRPKAKSATDNYKASIASPPPKGSIPAVHADPPKGPATTPAA